MQTRYGIIACLVVIEVGLVASPAVGRGNEHNKLSMVVAKSSGNW